MTSKKNDTPERAKPDSGPAPQIIAAAVGLVVVLLLIVANTARVDVNFIVYKAQEIQLWWYTILVAVVAVVAERLVSWAWRRSRRARDNRD
jgi:uncharacterized integral membrane protein